MSVKTAEIDTLVTIDIVATGRQVENLVDMPVVIRETVGVKIDMETGIDMIIVVIEEKTGITTIELAIDLAAL